MKLARCVVILFTFMLGVSVSSAWQDRASAAGGARESSAAANVERAANAERAGLVDINRATKDELKTLPGIRDAYAWAIVRNRPYKNKAQLRSRNVLPAATYSRIKDQIIAKQ